MNGLCILIGLSVTLGQVPVDSAETSTVKPAALPTPIPVAVQPKQTGVAIRPVQAAPPPPKVEPVKTPAPKPVRRVRKRTPKSKVEPRPKDSRPRQHLFLEIPDALALPTDGQLVSSNRESELYRFAWLLFCGLLLFLMNRLVSRAIRKASRDEKPWALIAVRAWPLLELVVWIALALWSVAYFWGTQNNFVLYTLIGVVLLVLATQWNVLRDIAAGLVFAAERSFEVGEVVRIGNAEGQLRRLRLRHLEIETDDGRLSQIPYRAAIGTTDVRSGGSSVAHTVLLDLDIPIAVDPKQALEAVLEMAASSPWSVVGLRPRVDLQANTTGSSVIRVEAYAFERDVKPALHADMLSGWKEIVKTLSDNSGRKV